MAMPVFANAAGFWALLGVPIVLAIHFLQQRSRPAITSTWFLIEKLVPRSVGGRTWERLRSSRTLWLQVLAVLVATWWLVEPRWPRAESAQTVVIVLDASVGMEPFRAPAHVVANEELAAADGLAARTTWVVMTSDPRQPPLYRGLDRAAAAASLERWQPQLGTHDLAPALRLAHSLAGESGRTLLITDSRGKVPSGQRAAGVGRVIDNVGFSGSTIFRNDTGLVWRAFIQNRSATTLHRTWWLETSAGRSAAQAIELAPAALLEITGAFPAGIEQCTLALDADAFPADDRLPMVRPATKPLAVAVDGDDAAAAFFRKLAASVDGVTITPLTSAKLRFARATAEDLTAEKRGGIFWPETDPRPSVSLMTDPVTPERHALVDSLNWQGWIGTGPHGYTATPSDTPLLWQDRWPIVFLRTSPAGARQLRLSFDWDRSNVTRLPAMMLLLRRYIEAERDAQTAPFSANYDTAAPLALAGTNTETSSGHEGAFTLSFQSAIATAAPEEHALTSRELPNLRAPGRAGFFTVRRGSDVIVRGAAQFADPRQGDFRAAETFFNDEPSEHRIAMERLTRRDPLALVWLIVLVGLVLGSWWTPMGGNREP